MKNVILFQDHDHIPSAVREYIMDQADAYFISEIPIEEINQWASNNLNLIARLVEEHHG
jgi:hypothetical protein